MKFSSESGVYMPDTSTNTDGYIYYCREMNNQSKSMLFILQ